jgi:hypothetical protein
MIRLLAAIAALVLAGCAVAPPAPAPPPSFWLSGGSRDGSHDHDRRAVDYAKKNHDGDVPVGEGRGNPGGEDSAQEQLCQRGHREGVISRLTTTLTISPRVRWGRWVMEPMSSASIIG